MEPSSNYYSLWEHWTCFERWGTADCCSVWTTELLMQPQWRADIRPHWLWRLRLQVQNHVSHPVQTVGLLSSVLGVDNCTSYASTQLQYEYEEISCWQSKDLWREGWPYQNRKPHPMTLLDVPEYRTRLHLTAEKFSGNNAPREQW